MKIMPDKQKAISLKESAKITLERLKETSLEKYPTNTLTDYYDILRKLMEALTSIEGIKIKGEGAHQKIIDYVCEKYNLGEATRQFIQQLRDHRNRISYEGFLIKESYITQNHGKIENIIAQLMELVNERL